MTLRRVITMYGYTDMAVNSQNRCTQLILQLNFGATDLRTTMVTNTHQQAGKTAATALEHVLNATAESNSSLAHDHAGVSTMTDFLGLEQADLAGIFLDSPSPTDADPQTVTKKALKLVEVKKTTMYQQQPSPTFSFWFGCTAQSFETFRPTNAATPAPSTPLSESQLTLLAESVQRRTESGNAVVNAVAKTANDGIRTVNDSIRGVSQVNEGIQQQKQRFQQVLLGDNHGAVANRGTERERQTMFTGPPA
jgi:hypothetical protein